MRKNILIWGIALVLVIIAVYTTGNFNKTTPLPQKTATIPNEVPLNTANEKAIDFKLMDLDGNQVSLSDYKGKNVYVNFFATWCPPCRGEMPEIEKISQEYKDQDLVVLAVDLGEDRDIVKSFVEENQYSFKVLLDSDQAVADQYNITSIPVSYFIDKEGNVVTKQVGAMTIDQMEAAVKLLMDKK